MKISDLGAVKICRQHDDAKSQDVCSVGIGKQFLNKEMASVYRGSLLIYLLAHLIGVAGAESGCKFLHQSVNFLGLTG